MKINNAKLFKTVYELKQLPPEENIEIAFAGRSNVGKSSLLNSIMGIKVAKISGKPGKTRSINYYKINDKDFFVDLPGYGYAAVSKKEREKWDNLLQQYFINRESLRLVCILIDSRHEPQKLDEMMVSWLKSMEIPFIIVLTKTDKLKSSEKNKKINNIKNILSKYGQYEYFPVSAIKKEGTQELLDYLDMFIK
ncbi:ribosome biogenesis GTP-binding protein YihA/YsxC [Oceanotoga sp. DSM 15011]|jgi:GTP-binding protein|uniref:Probable GTP-binding protein EngB n=1 Tax=Oceanotoga teriensis TaxID=515440 RepID=A0AA45C8H3_9BACT|nr:MULTISPECIES: ribosome biogenesis GTP-binding protein YihA/YsxC [Oceanotoga]MDN5343753.1 GTP-binding protein [Oceanotoga sp.]PWJ96158.1 GTP-binding protein [Oceanotoga teriensis]UYO99941.1 ribosome biogenesis GTP-binding protein YihA/YsxC [Oceanotoga sp. DSM 15011]